ncbi:hypothetical protein ACR56S_04660 [Staphylococcus hominis]|uniref:hypothetical protein n=1 Tax=Staphylococcus hominis TaxID=1290 RepID=UPI003D9FD500
MIRNDIMSVINDELQPVPKTIMYEFLMFLDNVPLEYQKDFTIGITQINFDDVRIVITTKRGDVFIYQDGEVVDMIYKNGEYNKEK